MADDIVTQPLAETAGDKTAQHEAAVASSVGWEPELAELRQRQALARELGGKDRVARQHAEIGRASCRERV